ncbi:MAG: biotin/lipoyl-containing protein [Planctomycetota bacterium]
MNYFTRLDGVEREFRFERRGGQLLAHCGDRTHVLELSMVGDGTAFSLLIDGRSHDLVLELEDGGSVVQLRGERLRVEVLDERERAAAAVAGSRAAGPQQICAVMPGVVVEVNVAAGDQVEEGQTVVVLEAMKMQNPLQAEGPGVVSKVAVSKGQAVAGGEVLLEIEAPDEEPA